MMASFSVCYAPTVVETRNRIFTITDQPKIVNNLEIIEVTIAKCLLYLQESEVGRPISNVIFAF